MGKLKLMRLLVWIFTLVFASIFFVQKTQAQTDSVSPLRIAVLAPLYLDSAFDDYDYKLGNLSIPKYFLPGLEFYNGAMMAVDSLQKEAADLEVWVCDTKKKDQSVDSLAKEMTTLHFSLIIASFSNTVEQKIFSEFSFTNNIPLISATYPNDAYVKGNPFFVMINSTLKTHVENIYRFMQRNYPAAKYIFITRNGSLEEKIRKMFSDYGKKTYPLNYKTIELTDDLKYNQIFPLLDSTKTNIIICGSVNETFGTNLLKALNESATFPLTVVGMPTWDGLKELSALENENLDIIFSTPYNYPKDNETIAWLSNEYKTKFNGRPSDMFFKGYETMYRFSKLLEKYQNDI
ncbi:MAG TPA: ABC transporter substrate-binding protein, partial [Chitinophagaceae bacterium]|nr:ABC transporter substrate-binding protein [Chitinophagaceae bacterium]